MFLKLFFYLTFKEKFSKNIFNYYLLLGNAFIDFKVCCKHFRSFVLKLDLQVFYFSNFFIIICFDFC